MIRSLFLLGLTGAAVALATLRGGGAGRALLRRTPVAGRCADQRRKLRWAGYTAADVS